MNFAEVLEHHILDHPLFPLFQHAGYTFYFTRHMLMMLIAGGLLLALGLLARRHSGRVPRGAANGLEAFIVYFRDEVVRPSLGPVADRYLGYFLTLFFFIL